MVAICPKLRHYLLITDALPLTIRVAGEDRVPILRLKVALAAEGAMTYTPNRYILD